jgi:hypothetical protein
VTNNSASRSVALIASTVRCPRGRSMTTATLAPSAANSFASSSPILPGPGHDRDLIPWFHGKCPCSGRVVITCSLVRLQNGVLACLRRTC